jgi:FAD/FMN-containing dehydrogenase
VDDPLSRYPAGATPLRGVFVLVAVTVTIAGAACEGRSGQGPADEPPKTSTLPAPLRAASVLVSSEPQRDFSRLERREHPQAIARPRTGEEVVQAVRAARAAGMPIRVRGRGHSMNSSALASEEELLVDTRGLRRVCRTGDLRVAAGAGISMVKLQLALAERGVVLPVVNGGGPGPSVGGFVSAGGFGKGSAAYGGFWQQVHRVQLVDGRGGLRMIARGDPLFPWLFGSAGQLGVIVGAELAVVPNDRGLAAQWKTGECFTVPEEGDVFPYDSPAPPDVVLYWWTLFVPATDAALAAAELAEIEERSLDPRLTFHEPYRYEMRALGVVPPLLFPYEEDAVALGIWATPTPSSSPKDAEPALRRVEVEVAAYAERRGYRRYLGAELAGGPDAYRANLGQAVWERFREIKAELDPAHLFGRGSVFPAPAP